MGSGSSYKWSYLQGLKPQLPIYFRPFIGVPYPHFITGSGAHLAIVVASVLTESEVDVPSADPDLFRTATWRPGHSDKK